MIGNSLIWIDFTIVELYCRFCQAPPHRSGPRSVARKEKTVVAQFDVAVVGYGPVGMACAALLGRDGHSVVVLERYPTLYNLPRAAIFDDETMRTFAKLDIPPTLLPKIHASPSYEWRNGAG